MKSIDEALQWICEYVLDHAGAIADVGGMMAACCDLFDGSVLLPSSVNKHDATSLLPCPIT